MSNTIVDFFLKDLIFTTTKISLYIEKKFTLNKMEV
jgi:hypothetical protein